METKKGLIVPKWITCGVINSSNCACLKSFEILRKDYSDYYAVGNVIGKHVIPSYQDSVLVCDFDFDLFTRHFWDFIECLGYVNVDVLGDYICKTCKGIYIIPTCDEMILSFQVMETCYKKIV